MTNDKPYAKAVIAFLAAVLIGVAFTGSGASPLSFVDSTCKDGIDNDMDGSYGGPIELILADFADGECVWMPQKFGLGEYDSLGLTDPTSGDPDVASYVSQWQQTYSSEMPSHFEIIKAAGDESLGVNICGSDVQSSLSAYKNVYGLPNEMTGANEHMAYCGVSY
jgi:hypothetical protein